MTVVISGSSGIQNVLGSAAAPSNTNGTSTNTGVYFPTSTTLGIATAGVNAVTVDASQNVGIGVTAPQEKLEVKTATSTQILVGAGLGFTYGIGRETVNGYLRFYGNQTTAVGYIFTGVDGERMRIDSSGNVGVGTSSPNTRLQVYKAAASAFTGTSPGALIVTDSTNTLNYFTSIDFNTTNVPSVPFARIGMGYTSGGSTLNFGTSNVYASGITNTAMTIGPTGIITMSAYTAGTATFSAAGVISSVSDETWKIKDGVPVDPDSMLKKLEPGYWYYNDEKKEIFGVDRQLGFYAQNVNSAIGPEAAPTPEEGKPWGYYDRSVLAVTVMSLQKALATIESLTARITALEAK